MPPTPYLKLIPKNLGMVFKTTNNLGYDDFSPISYLPISLISYPMFQSYELCAVFQNLHDFLCHSLCPECSTHLCPFSSLSHLLFLPRNFPFTNPSNPKLSMTSRSFEQINHFIPHIASFYNRNADIFAYFLVHPLIIL